jgi:hypothetical protein
MRKAALLLLSLLVVGCGASPAATPDATPTTSSVGEKDEWDLVFFSDSSGWHVSDRYAAHIEQDLDVVVEVHDLAASGLSAGSVLSALRGEGSP